MRIYYFIHLTGQDRGNTGIQRVVRNLGAALQGRSDVELIPVRWSATLNELVHADREFKEIIALFGGPTFEPSADEGHPLSAEELNSRDDAWLLVPEAPHLREHDSRYPSVPLFKICGYARRGNLRLAVIVHDILPLTFKAVRASETERLDFTIFAQSLFNANAILPVSRSSEYEIRRWLLDAGFREGDLPLFRAVLLPEEMKGVSRNESGDAAAESDRPIEFLSLGTVCAHKNQVRAMMAFNRLRKRRKDLNLAFNVVGNVAPELAFVCARQAEQSEGSIRLLGFQPDVEVIELTRRARATVFVSLAEGYGLPLAESLWLGAPCICSDLAPMTEIGVGGGCVLVNPMDVAEIERVLERLACDDAFCQNLRRSIETRPFRLWSDYAADIYDSLRGSELSAGAPPTHTPAPPDNRSLPAEEGRRAGRIELPTRMIDILASELTVHHAFSDSGASLFDGRSISFDRELYEQIDETTLFCGPNIALPAGRCRLLIDGSIDGAVGLTFRHGQGVQVIDEREVASFDSAIYIDMPERVDDFEIVARKTPTTRSLRIWSIAVECYRE